MSQVTQLVNGVRIKNPRTNAPNQLITNNSTLVADSNKRYTEEITVNLFAFKTLLESLLFFEKYTWHKVLNPR